MIARYKRAFAVKELKEEWTEKLHIEINSVIKQIVESQTNVDTAVKDRIVGKVMVITSEIITNLYKYESSLHFLLGVNFENGELTVHYRFPGKTLDIQKVYKRIEEVEEIYKDPVKSTSMDFLLGGERGFYYIKSSSDSFKILEIDSRDFKREIIVTFSVDKAVEYLKNETKKQEVLK